MIFHWTSLRFSTWVSDEIEWSYRSIELCDLCIGLLFWRTMRFVIWNGHFCDIVKTYAHSNNFWYFTPTLNWLWLWYFMSTSNMFWYYVGFWKFNIWKAGYIFHWEIFCILAEMKKFWRLAYQILYLIPLFERKTNMSSTFNW